jgi:hypothetical protein
MKHKIKEWLMKSDEEGITNFDAICMAVWNLIAWGLFFIGALVLKRG